MIGYRIFGFVAVRTPMLGKDQREARVPHHKPRVDFFLKCDLTLVVLALRRCDLTPAVLVLRRCAFTLVFGVSNISITLICHLPFKGFAGACMPL